MNEAPFRSAFACLNRRQVFQVGAGAVLVEVICSKAANASAKLLRGAFFIRGPSERRKTLLGLRALHSER